MNCNVEHNAVEEKVIRNRKMQTSHLTASGHLCTGGLPAPGSSPSLLPAPASRITCTATNQYGSAEYTTLLNSSGGLP